MSAPAPSIPSLPTASANDPWATVRATVIAACAGAAFASVDLRDVHRPAVRDAAAPALLLVAVMVAWWDARTAAASRAQGPWYRTALWILLWLSVPAAGFTVGTAPEATLLMLPEWTMLVGAAVLGSMLPPGNVAPLAGIGATMAVLRVVLGSSGEFWQREALAVALAGIVFAVLYRTIERMRRRAASPAAHRASVVETGLFVGAAVWILLGTLFLTAGSYDGPGMSSEGWSWLWGSGLGSYEGRRLEFLDSRSSDSPVSYHSAMPVELGLLGLLVFMEIFFPTAWGRRDRRPKQVAWFTDVMAYPLMPACLGLIAALLIAIRLPVHWLSGWLQMVVVLFAFVVTSVYTQSVGTAAPRARATSLIVPLAGVLALLLAIAQPIVLARTATAIQRGAPIPAWADALPWTVPVRERCIRLREGAAAPGAADPAAELKRLAQRWTRLAPHDEYAWIERIRAHYIADGPAATILVANEATRRLPASPIIARWYVRCLEESGHLDAAIAHVDWMRARFGSLNPTLLQWRQRAVEQRDGADSPTPVDPNSPTSTSTP